MREVRPFGDNIVIGGISQKPRHRDRLHVDVTNLEDAVGVVPRLAESPARVNLSK